MTRTNLGWSVLKAVLRRAEPGRAGTVKMYRQGKVVLLIAMSHMTVGIPHRPATALEKGEFPKDGVCFDGIPNSRYNESMRA
jgi:hypothetical protein